MPSHPRSARLREAHVHLAQHGRALGMIPLGDCQCVQECLDRVAAAASTAGGPPASTSTHWLLGIGLRVEAWSDPRYPTIAELDVAASGRPVCLWSFDHHALVVNSAALAACNIAESAPDPENGRLVRGARGQLTGLMLERAAKLVWERIPEPTGDQRQQMVLRAAQDLAGHGFVEVHDLLSQPWLGPLLAELHDAGELPLAVHLYPLVSDFPAAARSSARWERPTVRLAGAKLFADGTLNSRTAAMLCPYADPLPELPCGQLMVSPAQLADALAVTASVGLGLAVHAIGDAAVREVLDAFEVDPRREQPRRHGVPALRIEHTEVIDADDVPRFAELGAVCSVQPCHLLTDVEVINRSLAHRIDRVLPLRELIDSGCTPGRLLWFGSDTPIVRPHPEDSLQAALHRRRAEMPAAAALAPHQAITESEAWAAFGASPL